ncbi:MAG: hypothetical protein F4Z30_15810 [Gemmatimonadetes bacterium]|nr:hypothetical protein [Gemmatimonadota bacterium]
MTERKVWGAVLILCLGSRFMSAVYYIEDLDSLRFALGVVDFDVAKLQPHFPAYPVFCFLAKAIYALTDRYAVAFAMLGGAATFGIIYFALGIAQIKITTPLGLIAVLLLFFNPLLWLMSNRYMPDAMGVAGVLACCYFVAKQESGKAGLGFFIAGISLGVRLSYAPMLLVPLLLRLKERGPRLQFVAAGAAGVAVWLIPLIANTGWTELVKAAQTQTQGHFADFGGTVATEPDFALRSIGLFESIWADGFGLYWEGRHVVTACTTVALLGIMVANWRAVDRSVLLSAPFVGCVLYLGWIFLFQNVVHKSRHVLPLLPFLALIPAFACAQIATHGPRFFRLVVIAFFLCYGYVTLHLVVQHKELTAIAQIHQYLAAKKSDALHIASVPLIKYYLASQALRAVYIPVRDQGDLDALDALDGTAELVVIGSPLQDRVPKVTKTFYHNPYVNRMWSELTLYEY